MHAPALPNELVSAAIAWANAQCQYALAFGHPLSPEGVQIALRVGVSSPERVRIQWVNQLPAPSDPLFQPLLDSNHFASMAGLTLGYAILLVREQTDLKLVSHELRHVHQYERLGGIEGFMPVYLQEVATFGYADAPLEREARAHEISDLAGS